MLNEILASRPIDVDPVTAERMLATSPGNRSLRQKTIASYAAAMRRGEWMVAQPLIFDNAGQLRDGHHRLSAVVAAGITVPFSIIAGVSPDAYRVIDSGLNRTMTDRTGLKVPTIAEATLVFQICVSHSAYRPTAQQIEKICEGEWLANSDYLREQSPTQIKVFSSAPVRVAALYLMGIEPANRDYIVSQMRALASQDWGELSPRVRAFNRQAMNATSGAHSARVNLMVRAIRALDFSERDVSAMAVSGVTSEKVVGKFRAAAPKIFNLQVGGLDEKTR